MKQITKQNMMYAWCFTLLAQTLQANLFPSFMSRNVILLGSIQFDCGLDQGLELPILYKGKEYPAKVEINGDRHKAHFELYEEDRPTELYILITDYLALPDDPNVLHLYTSPDHHFRLFKLTKKLLQSDDGKEMLETWEIEEIASPGKSIIIPDNTVIIFLKAEAVEAIKPLPWTHGSNVINLPVIRLKEALSKKMLHELADRMKLALLDFKSFHKRENLASIPYANNRLLSMPFTTRRSYV